MPTYSYTESTSRTLRVPDTLTSINYLTRAITKSTSYQMFGAWTEVRKGSKVEAWRSKIRHVTAASSDYFRSDFVVKLRRSGYIDDGFVNTGPPSYLQKYYGTFAPYLAPGSNPLTLPTVDAEVDNFAKKAVIQSFSNKFRDLNLSNIFAEIDESAEMVFHRSVRLKESIEADIKTLRHERYMFATSTSWRRKHALGLSLTRFLAKRFIEMKFGWNPLMADISDAVKALDKANRSCVFRVSGKYSSPWKVTSSGSVVQTVTPAGTRIRFDYAFKTKQTVRYSYLFNLPNRSIPERLGLTAADIPGAVWERTWGSWFVDYFFDVSTFLESMRFSFFKAVTGSKALHRRSIYLCNSCLDRTQPTSTGYRFFGFNPAYLSIESFDYDRQTRDWLPCYIPEVKLLENLTPSRIAILGALAIDHFLL